MDHFDKWVEARRRWRLKHPNSPALIKKNTKAYAQVRKIYLSL